MTKQWAIRTLRCLHLLAEEQEAKEAILMAIKALKQPEQKKGKWIKNEDGTWSCSLCHSWISYDQHYYARYCLYCGAEMEVNNGQALSNDEQENAAAAD